MKFYISFGDLSRFTWKYIKLFQFVGYAKRSKCHFQVFLHIRSKHSILLWAFRNFPYVSDMAFYVPPCLPIIIIHSIQMYMKKSSSQLNPIISVENYRTNREHLNNEPYDQMMFSVCFSFILIFICFNSEINFEMQFDQCAAYFGERKNKAIVDKLKQISIIMQIYSWKCNQP